MTPLAPVLTGTAVVGALLHLGPALTGLPPLTRRIAPQHCSLARPGQVALTFDDGPHPRGTPAVLRALADSHCRATFFIIGEQAARFPHLIRDIHEQGHELAVHGWSHTAAPLLTPTRAVRHLRDTADLITALSGRRPRWYRPPYGVASGSALAAARGLGLRPVWWTRWARDWSRQATMDSILAKAVARPDRIRSSGETLLLHDSDTYGGPGSWRFTAAALPIIVNSYRRAGIEVG